MLSQDFFQRDVLTVARELVGAELIWRGCSGIIVETEAYAAKGDEACHTMTRPSAREFVETHSAGSAYVYFNYGMYWMLNILVKGGGNDGLVLLRGLQPIGGLELMQQRRTVKKAEQLCSGPGKLAMALGITGADHGRPLVGKNRAKDCGLRMPTKTSLSFEVGADVRVGISKAADFPWRFLAIDNAHVSVRFGKVKPFQRPIKKARRDRLADDFAKAKKS